MEVYDVTMGSSREVMTLEFDRARSGWVEWEQIVVDSKGDGVQRSGVDSDSDALIALGYLKVNGKTTTRTTATVANELWSRKQSHYVRRAEFWNCKKLRIELRLLDINGGLAPVGVTAEARIAIVGV